MRRFYSNHYSIDISWLLSSKINLIVSRLHFDLNGNTSHQVIETTTISNRVSFIFICLFIFYFKVNYISHSN